MAWSWMGWVYALYFLIHLAMLVLLIRYLRLHSKRAAVRHVLNPPPCPFTLSMRNPGTALLVAVLVGYLFSNGCHMAGALGASTTLKVMSYVNMLIKTCVLPALILTASEVAHKVAGGPRTKTCAQNQVLRLLSACIMLIMMVLGLTNFSSCATAGSLKLFWWQGFAYYAVPWSTRSYYVEIVVFSWCFLVGLCVLFRLRWPWLALAQAVALAGICTAHMSYEFAMTTANFWDCLCVGSIVLAEIRVTRPQLDGLGEWLSKPLTGKGATSPRTGGAWARAVHGGDSSSAPIPGLEEAALGVDIGEFDYSDNGPTPPRSSLDIDTHSSRRLHGGGAPGLGSGAGGSGARAHVTVSRRTSSV